MVKKDTLSHKKSLIKSTINNIIEKLSILGSKILKNKKKLIKKQIRLDEITIDDNDLGVLVIEHINRFLNKIERYILK